MVKKHKRAGLSKFLVVLVIFLSYLVVSVLQFGISSGILVALLSWSFFVFCTPIADAGLLLDFPTRILTGMRMLHTEIMVWIVAVILNVTALSLSPDTYEKTALLHLFHQIITTPWPLGLIVMLSAAGTYLSIYLGDGAYDIASSKDKKLTYQNERKKFIHLIYAFVATIILYAVLLKYTHIHIQII